MMLVDIGVNLTNGQFRRDLPQVLHRAAQAGVDTMVITGTSVQESRRAVQLAGKHADTAGVALFTTVGVHPHDAKDFDEHRMIEEMRAIIDGKDGALVVAVGECGLDFNRDYSPRDAQVRAFRAQVALACELQMPLFVHEREAHEALVKVLNPFVEAGTLPPTVVHCFTGQEQEMHRYLDMGFSIGLTGFVCMEPRGMVVRDMVPFIPMSRLMIETDAPFMYPYSGSGMKKRARRQTSSASETKVVAKPMASRPTSKLDEVDGAIVLDGGVGEGGGQVLRVATALCAVMHNVVRVHSIRANRKAPGLRNQHVGTIELVAALSTGGILSGALLNSTDLTFDTRSALLRGGIDEGAFHATSPFIRVTAFGVSATEQLADRYGNSMKAAVKETFSNGEHDIAIDVECIVETTIANLKKRVHRGKKPKEKTAVSALILLETASGGLLSVDRTVEWCVRGRAPRGQRSSIYGAS
ncbi:hypothetical protein BBP00_00005668 [Phytophthora kernoviae]|uniref:RNA 3'-terminal phosphate cyclase domain-containing protein n=1 Tax=Phytophthora kernoviae TaxID=325452 RepID=A0A3F2RNF3_9STRA|nr:hypothetical protein BBP00_00005668 [Phytophthora kernoviae]